MCRVSWQAPKPYNFGFEVRDDDTTNYQNRAEASDSEGRVRGSYSYVLPDGFVYTVTYEDNKDGEGLKVGAGLFPGMGKWDARPPLELRASKSKELQKNQGCVYNFATVLPIRPLKKNKKIKTHPSHW